jgi:hypothetical protein
MCFNKQLSIASFVVGTVLNVLSGVGAWKLGLSRLDVRFATLALWQFGLLMQLPEAVAWSSIDNNAVPSVATEKAAYWLNLLQPLVAVLVWSVVHTVANKVPMRDDHRLWISWILPVIFTIAISVGAKSTIGAQGGISPAAATTTRSCNHLNLHWWHDYLPLLPLYLAAIAVAALLLVEPVSQKATQIGYFLGSLVLSASLYECGVASVWCWFVAFAGPTVLIP